MENLFTKPNVITFLRVLLLPFFVIILLSNLAYKNYFAAIVFVILALSDVLDGYIARREKQITELGKIFDPIADKILVFTALVFLVGRGIDLWMAISIMVREILITVIRIALLPSKIVIAANTSGKLKTIFQYIAIVAVLIGFPFGWHLMLFAVVLTIYSGITYLWEIRNLTGTRIINMPNMITLFRFLLIIPFIYYFFKLRINLVVLLFAAIAVLDKLDGISARIMNQKTEIGSWFDSFTDYSLILSTFVLMYLAGFIELVWVILLVVPSMGSGLLKLVYFRKQKLVPVTLVARLSVGLTYITAIYLLLIYGYKIDFDYHLYILSLTVIMVYVSMISYIAKNLALQKPADGKPRKKKFKAA